MRRIDAIGIGIGIFVVGGLLYIALQTFGLDSVNAGIWTQAVLVGGLVGWLLTYLVRALTGSMTYSQQLKDYEDAFLQKRLDDMSPEELAQLQSELDAAEAAKRTESPNPSTADRLD